MRGGLGTGRLGVRGCFMADGRPAAPNPCRQYGASQGCEPNPRANSAESATKHQHRLQQRGGISSSRAASTAPGPR